MKQISHASASSLSANSNTVDLAQTSGIGPATMNEQCPNFSGESIAAPHPEHRSDKSVMLAIRNQSWQDQMGLLFQNSHQIEEPTTNTSESANVGASFFHSGEDWERRFEVSGKLEDINEAIECYSQALQLTPSAHSDKAARLSNLGNSHLRRSEHLGDLADINKAIECHSQAVLLTPDGHGDKSIWIGNLGNSYQGLFERLGDLADLDKAVACRSEAVLRTPDDHIYKPAMLSNLGASLRARFGRLGNRADIDRAIECHSQAALMTPDGHADKPFRLNNFGASLQSRYWNLGSLADMNQAIACHSQAALLIPDGHAQKPVILNNLGTSLHDRYKNLSNLADIDKAIECQSQAILLTPASHADKPSRLGNLGNSHRGRFEHLRNLADINKAIAYLSQAVLLTPDGHPSKPVRLNNLCGSYLSKFQHLSIPADIDSAIECQLQAVLLTPEGHADKPTMLNNLGCSHLRRSEQLSSNLADLNQAIDYQSQAILITHDGHVHKPSWLNNLGASHRSRFEHLGDLADLGETIECHSQAILLTPDGHAHKPTWLSNLGNAYRVRYERLGEPADIDRAITCLREAAHFPAGISLARFRDSRMWAQLSTQSGEQSALSAYQWTMDLVPKVVWIGSALNQRHEHTKSVGATAVEAAAVAISKKEYGLALEWLEAGRSVVWSQILQLRTQFDDLSRIDSELAQALRKVALDLEQAGSPTPDIVAPSNSGSTLEAAAQKHRRLAEQYENLISRARRVPGFHDFMRPKRAAELMSTARSGPVVVVNVHKSRCDALILRPHADHIMHVPLPDISDTKVVDLQRQMKGFASRGMTERKPRITSRNHKGSLESILSTLWHKIVKPVLDSLGYAEKPPVDQLPHITWCTTGALSMLPVHVAGCYNQAGENLFAYAVSSFTPTLSALISSDSHSLELGAILAVSQEATLPATKKELAHIKRHAGELRYLQLQNDKATAEAVLDAMEKFDSVHLACHASQNLSQPLESCFYLHDRSLTLADITRRSLKHKGLAFLSACQTATGDDKSPDEAIHLAAGMLVAGYPTVIATMWSIIDRDAPVIADLVYDQLTKDKKLDNGKVARALHVAVAALRDRVGEKEFVRWAPYIHMGV